MADGIELAKAYVQIVPTTKNIKQELTSAMSGDAEKAGEETGGVFGKAMKKAIGIAAAGVTAAAGGVAAIAKSAVSAYADFEQLTGGVETLFEKTGVSQQVLDNAAKAFATAGLSANDYMETVTSFSASLIAGLGDNTEQAAAIADRAIIDMSDNANKMGSDIESIQNAYSGFAKQNYTMLDNLKLGYGGTASEMLRLVNNAIDLQSTYKDVDLGLQEHVDSLDNISYDQIINAIHLVQEDMGVMGATAAEASSTISGSVGSMQAAWQNLVVGMADDQANFDLLVQNFALSAESVIANLMPRIQIALDGVGQLVASVAPIIIGYLPTFIAETLPGLVETALTLFLTLNQTLIDNLPLFADTAFQVIITLITGLSDFLPKLLAQAPVILDALTDALINNMPLLLDSALSAISTLINGLIQNLPKLIQSAFRLISALAQGLIQYLPTLLQQAPVIITRLCNGIAQNLPQILRMAGQLIVELVRGIIRALPQILSAGWDIIKALVRGVTNVFSSLWQLGKDIVQNVWRGLTGKISDAATWGRDLIQNFIGGLRQRWENLKGTVSNIAGSIKSLLGFSEPEEGPLSDFHTYAPDMMELFAKGIRDNETLVTGQIEDSFALRGVIGDAYGEPVTTASSVAPASISINVYASDGMDVRDLARKVAEEIADSTRRKELAWA